MRYTNRSACPFCFQKQFLSSWQYLASCFQAIYTKCFIANKQTSYFSRSALSRALDAHHATWACASAPCARPYRRTFHGPHRPTQGGRRPEEFLNSRETIIRHSNFMKCVTQNAIGIAMVACLYVGKFKASRLIATHIKFLSKLI